MKKRSYLRTFLFISTLIIVILAALYSQNYFSFAGEHAAEIEEPIGDTVVTLEDYKVYDLLDVPFRFVIAEIKISNVGPINFELSRFQTDEGLILNAIDEYRSEITRKGYDLSIQNITTQLSSNENELVAKILIPIQNNYRQIIRVAISGIKTDYLLLDLSDGNLGKGEDLGKTELIATDPVNPNELDNPDIPLDPEVNPDEPSDSQDNPDEPSDSQDNPEVNPDEPVDDFISNKVQFISGHLINKDLILYKGLEGFHRVDFASGVRILLVNVTFDFDHDVSIVAARLNFSESGDLAFALGPEYVNDNGNNVLGKTVSQESGSLLFQIDNNLYDLVNQPYNIEVRFKDSKQWMSIEMN